MTNTIFAVCEVADQEYEPGWGVRYDDAGILVATSGELIKEKIKELQGKDTKSFSYKFGPINVHRIEDMSVANEINENGILWVVRKERVQMVKDALKPF